jgi:ParB/RepB/Spo0J family partition protein
MAKSKDLANKKRLTLFSTMENIMSDNEQLAQGSNGKKRLEKIPLHLIRKEKNIRSSYSDESINELSESLKVEGLLQPIVVAETENGYTILYGHRRFLAAEKAGWEEIDCIVQSGFKDEIARITAQITENEHREDISPADKEAAVLDLEEKYNLSAEAICNQLGKSRSWYTQIKGAHKFRQQYGKLFEDAGVPLYTKEAYHMKDVSEEQVSRIIADMKSPDMSKAALVSALSDMPKQNKETRGRKPKQKGWESAKADVVAQSVFNIEAEPLGLEIAARITLEKNKLFSLSVSGTGDEQEGSLIETISHAVVALLERDGFNRA